MIEDFILPLIASELLLSIFNASSKLFIAFSNSPFFSKIFPLPINDNNLPF